MACGLRLRFCASVCGRCAPAPARKLGAWFLVTSLLGVWSTRTTSGSAVARSLRQTPPSLGACLRPRVGGVDGEWVGWIPRPQIPTQGENRAKPRGSGQTPNPNSQTLSPTPFGEWGFAKSRGSLGFRGMFGVWTRAVKPTHSRRPHPSRGGATATRMLMSPRSAPRPPFCHSHGLGGVATPQGVTSASHAPAAAAWAEQWAATPTCAWACREWVWSKGLDELSPLVQAPSPWDLPRRRYGPAGGRRSRTRRPTLGARISRTERATSILTGKIDRLDWTKEPILPPPRPPGPPGCLYFAPNTKGRAISVVFGLSSSRRPHGGFGGRARACRLCPPGWSAPVGALEVARTGGRGGNQPSLCDVCEFLLWPPSAWDDFQWVWAKALES